MLFPGRFCGNPAALAGAAASAGITVTTLGTNASGASATVNLSITAGVPAGALIVVCVADSGTGGLTGMSASDPTNGPYTAGPAALNNNTAASGSGSIWYFWNSAVLASGTILSYTGPDGTPKALSAFYATGIQTSSNPGEASATATGSSTTPSVASGSPTGAGELFVGCVSDAGPTTFTQDSTNAAYATPPDRKITAGSGAVIAGGGVVNAGSSALTYAPTLGATPRAWAALIIAFKHA